MSAGQQLDPALAFLAAASPTRRRRPRRNAETLRLWFRLAMVCVLFLTGVALWLVLPSSFEPMSPSSIVLATAIGTAIGLEVSRGRFASGHLGIMLIAGVSAGLSEGLVLVCVGVPWRLAMSWAAVDMTVSVMLLAGLSAGYRHVLTSLMREGRLAKRVAVVGSGEVAHRAAARLERADPLAFQVAGRYSISGADLAADHRGDLRTLLCDARLDMIDTIVLALEPGDHAGFDRVLHDLRACVQDVLVADEKPRVVPEGVPVRLGAADMVMLKPNPIRGTSMAAKRVFDVIVAGMLLAFTAPLLGLLALAIRLETSGPILFRQLRVGYNNQLFYILKFRSMYWQASDRLAKQQTVRGDKRITRIGKVIRRLSLDELPQLLNVMRGEMSLVGPRPHAPGTNIGGQRVHTLVEDYACRHLVRPGITGLAQVRGLRGGLQDRRQVVDRIASDLEYIQRWSLWLDVRILLGTVLLELHDSRGC